MTQLPSQPLVVIHVCRTCKGGAPTLGDQLPDPSAPRAGAVLLEQTSAASLDARTPVRVIGVDCLGNCARGPSAALQAPDRWTYVFGGLTAPEDGAALVEGAALLADAADGVMPWRGRPDALKRGLIARVPPPGWPAD